MSLTQVNSAGIADGAIVNADLHSSSDIALSKLNTSGTASSSTFLRGDGAWTTVDLTALSASNLTSGTVPDARFPATLPAVSGTQLTNLNASNISSGTLAAARLPASYAVLSGSTDNTIATVTGANAIQGEANLTFDGDNLIQTINSSGEGIQVATTGDVYPQFTFKSNRGSNNNVLGYITTLWNNKEVGFISFNAGDDTTNKDNGSIRFGTSSANNVAERLRIDSSGMVGIGKTPESAVGSILQIKGNDGISFQRPGESLSTILRPLTSGLGLRVNYQNGSEIMRIDNSGNVGIGTTSPAHPFHLLKSQNTRTKAVIQNNWGANATAELNLISPTDELAIIKYASGPAHIELSNSSDLKFYIGGSEKLRIHSGGTVQVQNHLTSRNGIVQINQVTSTTRFSGTLVANVIEGSSFTPKTSAPRFLIMIFCPVNTSDDSDAANGSTNPYFYGRLEYQKNSGSWLECDNQGSTSDQGGSAAHIEMSPNRTGDNDGDSLSGNRYRMEHKQATVLVTNVGDCGTSGNVKFKLRVYAQHQNFLHIGQPHGHGTDDNYPVQPWGFTVFELAPDSNSYTAY